jgi:hypothetical protein
VCADDKPLPTSSTLSSLVCVRVSVFIVRVWASCVLMTSHFPIQAHNSHWCVCCEIVGIVCADEKPLPSPSTPFSLVCVCLCVCVFFFCESVRNVCADDKLPPSPSTLSSLNCVCIYLCMCGSYWVPPSAYTHTLSLSLSPSLSLSLSLSLFFALILDLACLLTFIVTLSHTAFTGGVVPPGAEWGGGAVVPPSDRRDRLGLEASRGRCVLRVRVCVRFCVCVCMCVCLCLCLCVCVCVHVCVLL